LAVNRPSDLRDEILELEQSCLLPEVRADPARLAALIADDFLEFGSSGRTWNRATVLSEVPTQSGLEFELSDFEAVQLSEDLVHTRFRTALTEAGSTRHALRSSLWVRRSGRWQMLFHQGTSCAAP